jgi:general nucleoside transport system ATP-binding protein
MTQPYLQLDLITKQFGSFTANNQISLSVQSGEIHALLGENGAGKSTLMNILCGLYRPTSGQIYLNQQPVQIASPGDAIAHGIGMIHQHFMLVPQLTVVENIILGMEQSLRLNRKQQAKAITQMAETYGLAVDPWATVGELPVGAQQRVEILKALYRNARLLILDEPTAVLTPPEVERFFVVLRDLATHGHTIIFISHKLDEVMALCQTVTVLQRGNVVASRAVADTTPQELAQLMVGRAVNLQHEKAAPTPTHVVLDIANLHVNDDRALPALRGLSVTVRAGEILAIAGVDGNGQREFADAIAGLRPALQGHVQINSSDVTQWSPRQRVQHLKLGYIPEDRQKMGLILPFSIARNLILKVFQKLPFCRRWLLQSKEIAAHANQAIQSFDIRATSGQLRVSQLSGGNQQKVVLARELSGQPDLIVAMQPTRGLDIGATDYVQKALLAERDRGAAIVYISTELEEVMAMGDRIGVMYEGQLVTILEGRTATIEEVGLWMAGGKG